MKKTQDFWQLHFSTKLPKKTKILCSDSINNSELEGGLLSDFQNFIQNVTPDIGERYFNLMDRKMFGRICKIETKKLFLRDQINSKRHKGFEHHFF